MLTAEDAVADNITPKKQQVEEIPVNFQDLKGSELEKNDSKVDKTIELSLRKRVVVTMVTAVMPLIVVWAIRPFDRIIDYLLPPSSLAVHEQRSKLGNHSEPIFNHSLFQNRNAFPFRQCSQNATLCCNGLENLCDLPINDVMFATVHNAMAAKENGKK